MPKLLQTIYEIAVAKGRDVLCVVFGDLRLPPPHYDGMLKELDGEVIEQPCWETHPVRQQVLGWLNENGIGYLETALPLPGWIGEGYAGSLYLDVPFDTANPDYKRLADFLENPDQIPRLPGMTFWAVPLDCAQREVEKSKHWYD